MQCLAHKDVEHLTNDFCKAKAVQMKGIKRESLMEEGPEVLKTTGTRVQGLHHLELEQASKGEAEHGWSNHAEVLALGLLMEG